MVARTHRFAAALWLALAGGAGLGFVARDLLEVGQPGVAGAWVAGAVTGALSGWRHHLGSGASRLP